MRAFFSTMRNVILNIILLISIGNCIVQAAKLNFPRVLLPIFQEKQINFTLEVIERSCFKWTSSRQDLISITPIYGDNSGECSYQAVVTVHTRERSRNTAIVFAEEFSSGETLRCDVIVDIIEKLNVRTTTRQLYLEEAPEIFELHAFDSQGNEFSTLEGIEFNWVIEAPNRGSSKIKPALRFLSFSDSPYHDVPASLEKFEGQGIKGYMVLLEGINTGTSKVSVNIPYADYNDVAAIDVTISVLANLIIEPSDVHILAGDTIKFRILQLKMGKLHEIQLDNQYFFEVEDNRIASVDGRSATGLRLGRTSIVLRDLNVAQDSENNGMEKQKGLSAQLTVAEPEKIGISLLPYNNWLTVVSEKHVIVYDLYTSEEQKITLGTKYKIVPTLEKALFSIIGKTQNGSRVYCETVIEGVSQVYGTYKTLSAQAEIQIFGNLLLQPSKVILPFDPNLIKTQKIQFEASGGDGNYVWYSAQPRLLHINSQGLATTTIREANVKQTTSSSDVYDGGSLISAHASIKVALQKNQKIIRQSEIYFLPPQRLEIKRFNFETALNDYVAVHIALYAFANNTQLPYTRCENLILDLEFSNQIFHVDNNHDIDQEFAPESCQILYLRSTALGTTSLRISYKFQGKVLQDVINLNVFEPLSLLNPLESEIVLPIGASRNVIYANGPQRVYTLEAELDKATYYNSRVAKVTEIEHHAIQNAITAFTVLCLQKGETSFKYSVHNTLKSHKFHAYKSEISINVYCVRPRFLKLYATQQLRSSCPLEMRSSLLHLKDNERKFEIEIEVQDANNRKLMNISSLVIDWEFAAGDEKYHTDSIPHSIQSNVEYSHGVKLPVKDVLVTTLTDVDPNFRIKGTVARYNDKMLSRIDIYAERPPFGIEDLKTGEVTKPLIENEIRFLTVNSTFLPFTHANIFLEPSHIERIYIAQGSGHYEYTLSEQGIINVEYDAKERNLLLKPLRLGNVRIELTDLCLPNEAAHLTVAVVGLGSIHTIAQDRVELTKSIDAIVRLVDSNGHFLNIDRENLSIYELNEEIYDTNVISIKIGHQENLGTGEIRYIITGKNIGETKIVFNSGRGNNQITSEPLIIQVFAPIRLYPRNSTLIVGSSIQIYYQGGPQPNVNIVYQVENKLVASMESAIVTAHKLGTTTITGKCVVKNPITGQMEIISEDTIEVHVTPLVNIQIRTPLTRIRNGAIMPATIWGQPDLSPMILGTLENMKITWTTNQTDVVEIHNIFSAAGIEYKDTDLISVRVLAMSPGRANLHASLQLADGVTLKASVEVIVFETLELSSPKQITMDWILAAPRSSLQLKCNLANVRYKLGNDSSSGIVTVTPDGLVRTKDTLGRDLIIAKSLQQTLPIGIEVKNVQYILVSLVDSIKLKQFESKIPRGMNFVLKVSLHDNLGNEFSHNIEDGLNGIKYELSTNDIMDVHIGNNLTVVLNLPRETSNMIAISLKDTTGVKHAEDYIKLAVAESQHIYPTKTIFSVGDIICFDSPLTTSSIWSSSNEQILSIDRYTGVARVHGNRFRLGEKIVVTNGDKTTGGGFIKYDVEVREADMIHFLKSYDVFSGIEYRADLVMRNHLQTDKLANLIAQNVSKCIKQLENLVVDDFYTCRLQSKHSLGPNILKHYQVKPTFDAASGRYACQIELLNNFNEILGIVKTTTVHLDLEVSLPDGLSDTLSLKFVPGIKVTPLTLESFDLDDQELTISGLDKVLQKVEVTPSDSSLMSLKVEVKAHGLIKYKVSYLQPLPMDVNLYVLVYSPETYQKIEIPVASSTLLMQKCSTRPFGFPSRIIYNIVQNIGLVISTCIVVGVTIWLYFYCFTVSPEIEANTSVFASASNTSCSTTSIGSESVYSKRPNDSSIYGSGEPSIRMSSSRNSRIFLQPSSSSSHSSIHRQHH